MSIVALLIFGIPGAIYHGVLHRKTGEITVLTDLETEIAQRSTQVVIDGDSL
jgi:hypothetical protein